MSLQIMIIPVQIFYQACEFNTLDSCEISDEICRPKTGFRPYDKIFGPGITSGDREFNVINNCEYDMVITIKDNRTRHSIRTEYVRSGEKTSYRKYSKWTV